MKKLSILAIVLLFSFVSLSAYCAEPVKKAPMNPPINRPMASGAGNMVFIMGSISKIDTSDPNNAKLTVVNDADKKAHVLELGPRPNIAKLIDISELKEGEKTRIVARAVNDKEIAVSVVTGKIRLPAAPKAGLTPAKPAAQKEQTKKK